MNLDLLTNSNFDISIYEKELRRLINTLYTTNKRVQQNTCGIKKFEGNVSDFQLHQNINYHYDLPRKSYTVVINEDVVKYFAKKNFYSSKKTDKFTLDAINTEDKYFDGRVKFFIDGFLMQDVTLVHKDSASILSLNITDFTESKMEQLVSKGAKWTLLIEPNSSFSSALNTKSILFNNNKVALSLLTKHKHNKKTSNNWSVFFTKDQSSSSMLISGSAILNTITNTLDLTENLSTLATTGALKFRAFDKPNYLNTIKLINGERWFCIDEDGKLLVPKNNIMVWSVNPTTGLRTYIHNPEIVEYYPYGYQITNIPESITTIDIEYSGKIYDEIVFKNIAAEYIEFIGGNSAYLAQLKNGTFPAELLNIPSIDIVFSIKDHEELYSNLDKNEYILKKLRDYITQNPDIYKELFSKIAEDTFTGITDSWIIDSSINTNLTTREIYSTSDILIDPTISETFPEPYTFVVMTSSNSKLSRLRIWINGLRTLEFKQYNEAHTEYICFPKRLVGPDTIVEIERIYTDDKITEDILFTTINDIITLTSDFKLLPLNSLMFTNNFTKEYISTDQLEISINIEGIPTILNMNSNLLVDPNLLNIKILSNDLVDTIIEVTNTNQYIIMTKENVNEFGSVILPFTNFQESPSLAHVEVFVAGRKSAFDGVFLDMDLPTKKYDSMIVSLSVPYTASRIDGILEYLPYAVEPVYSALTIPSNGVINLMGSISKPFDLEYHDVYLNGKKLNYSDINIISDNIIQLTGVNSLKNLYIYEKGTDNEILSYIEKDDLGNITKYPSFYDQFINEHPEFVNYLITNPIIIVDTDTDIFNDGDVVSAKEAYAINFINQQAIIPDIDQITGKYYNIIKPIFVEGVDVYRVNPDTLSDLTGKTITTIHYNPDNYISTNREDV